MEILIPIRQSLFYQTEALEGMDAVEYSYHGYAMREITVNSTSLYETN